MEGQVHRATEQRAIFLSHFHEEGKIAEAIQLQLKKILGNQVQVFLSEEIALGKKWFDDIRDNLSQAHFILILLSSDSTERPWIYIETGYGLMAHKEVIPIYGNGLKEMPPIFRDLEGVNIKEEAGIRKLLEKISPGASRNQKTAVRNWQAAVSKAISKYTEQQSVRFKLKTQESFLLFNRYSGAADYHGRCLDVADWREDSGALIIGFAPHGGANQLWKLQRTKGGYFRITNANSGLCLEARPGNDGAGYYTILQNAYDEKNEQQQWLITAIEEGHYYKISVSQYASLCLSMRSGPDPYAAQVTLERWNDKPNQKWLFKIMSTVRPV